MLYRPDIDGLRALAVVLVILWHADAPGVPGGFIGVDMFFVISGYLITGFVHAEIAGGVFSFRNFYIRRARRLLPALYAVMIASTVPAYFFMLPEDLENFGQSLVATSLFSNNILLALTSGYWTAAAEFKPLMHTWSLGVEEQFYAVYPMIFFLLAMKARSITVPVLIALATVSFAACSYIVVEYPDAAFMLLPFRLWELLAGAIAFMLLPARPFPKWVAELGTLVGLAIVCIASATLDDSLHMPGYPTIFPVLGTLLIIMFGHHSAFIGKTLDNSLMVRVGLISYGLYLWHYTLFVYFRLTQRAEPVFLDYLPYIAASFVLAALSHRYIESPFRQRDVVSNRVFIQSFAAMTVALVITGLTINHNQGFSTRYFDEETYVDHESLVAYSKRIEKLKKDSFVSAEKTKVLILGNSYARDVANILLEGFDNSKLELVYRSDFYDCVSGDDPTSVRQKLIRQADVLLFARGNPTIDCIDEDTAMLTAGNKRFFHVDYKYFGYNINWIRWSEEKVYFNDRENWEIQLNERNRGLIPPAHYLSLMDLISTDTEVRFSDDNGRLLTLDGRHLTVFGARYLATQLLDSEHPLVELLPGKKTEAKNSSWEH